MTRSSVVPFSRAAGPGQAAAARGRRSHNDPDRPNRRPRL